MTTNPKSVFVGNIPFALTEEQIVQILSNAGQVVRFRLITNPENGKPRGYGFADFADAETAASAVRNLNGYEISGRKIRVDWPTEKDQPGGGQDQAPPHHYQEMPQQAAAAPPPTVLPPLPPGKDLPPNLTATDAISQTLNSLPPTQLLDVLTQVKAMAISEPARLTELLKAAPQLSFAVFQALILMNLVDPKILGQVVEQASTASRPQQPPQIPQMPPQPQIPQMPPQPTPQQYPVYPPQQLQQPPMPQHQPYPPPRPPPQQYPPPQQPTPQPQMQQQQPPMDQQALLQQVLQMDQRTIDALPPHERQQIMAIRQSMGVR